MLSCKEVVKIISSDDKQSWKHKLSIRLHLLFCRHCRKYVKHLDLLSKGIKKLIQQKAESIDDEKIKKIEEQLLTKLNK